MAARGIKTRADLSGLSGVGQQQLSQWRHGKNQPRKDLLERIAPVLEVPLLALELKAGLVKPEQLDTPPDTTVLPAQFKRAIDAYLAAKDDRPDLVPGLLERVDDVADWYERRAPKKKRKD